MRDLCLAGGLCALSLIAGCLSYSDQPIEQIEVRVRGNDYRFYFQYPGEDLLIDTDDDCYGSRNLHVPNGSKVVLRVTSDDFVYTFEIPKVELYEAAVPQFDFDSSFSAPSLGKHDLLGSQMCGYDHPDLLGKLIVQKPSEFRRFMDQLSTKPHLK